MTNIYNMRLSSGQMIFDYRVKESNWKKRTTAQVAMGSKLMMITQKKIRCSSTHRGRCLLAVFVAAKFPGLVTDSIPICWVFSLCNQCVRF